MPSIAPRLGVLHIFMRWDSEKVLSFALPDQDIESCIDRLLKGGLLAERNGFFYITEKGMNFGKPQAKDKGFKLV